MSVKKLPYLSAPCDRVTVSVPRPAGAQDWSTRKQTIAEQIARDLGNDGQNFRGEKTGQPLDVSGETRRHSRLTQEGTPVTDATITWRNGEGADTYRLNFDDGSAIVVSGDAWDLAVAGSDDADFCWAGVGHDHRGDR